MGNTIVNSKVKKEGGDGGAAGAGARISMQPTKRTTEVRISTVRPVRDPTTEQVDIF